MPISVIDVRDYGVMGNGIDDTTAMEHSITAANTANLMLYIPNNFNCNIATAATLYLPTPGITGGGKISNTLCVFFQQKSIVVDDFKCDDLLLSGVWFSDFRQIECRNLTIDGGNNSDWGTFWNRFGIIICEKLTIDCDQQQAVNQNTFDTVKASGGLHIKGVNVTGIREAHGNVFYSIDTTGAAGDHILNDSQLNQTNIIHMWYAELTGSRAVKGNWHILGSNIDSDGGTIRTSERNHYLFSSIHIPRNNGDFMAAGISNLAIGGEWDVLNANWEAPYSLTFDAGLSISTPFDTTGCPSGINKQISKETSLTNQAFNINFSFTSPKALVGCLWYQGDDFESISSDGNVYVSGSGIYIHPSGWKLLRFAISEVSSYIKLWVNTGTAGYKRISVNSFFITDQKTAFLPSVKSKTVVRGQAVKSAGSTFTIAVPTSAYQMQRNGLAKIFFVSDGSAPTFQGASGCIFTPFAKNRYNNTDYPVAISPSAAIVSVNGGATSFISTGTTEGIQISIPSGINDVTFNYELEIHE